MTGVIISLNKSSLHSVDCHLCNFITIQLSLLIPTDAPRAQIIQVQQAAAIPLRMPKFSKPRMWARTTIFQDSTIQCTAHTQSLQHVEIAHTLTTRCDTHVNSEDIWSHMWLLLRNDTSSAYWRWRPTLAPSGGGGPSCRCITLSCRNP